MVSNYTNMSTFQPLKVVDRGSETQLQVGENIINPYPAKLIDLTFQTLWVGFSRLPHSTFIRISPFPTDLLCCETTDRVLSFLWIKKKKIILLYNGRIKYTGRWPDTVLMLDYGRRRCPNIKTTLRKRLVFAGSVNLTTCDTRLLCLVFPKQWHLNLFTFFRVV